MRKTAVSNTLSTDIEDSAQTESTWMFYWKMKAFQVANC